MKTSRGADAEIERFQGLVDRGILTRQDLEAVARAAVGRGIDPGCILRREYRVPRRKILEVLGEYYGCAWVEYDERVPVPPDLLAGLDPERLCASGWIPVARHGGKLVVAAADPGDPNLADEIKEFKPGEELEIRVALEEEVRFLIGDFLNGSPEHLIGNERTGLAFWRNTMARWRTKLACYRTDFAVTRTHLSVMRAGLGLITMGSMLVRLRPQNPLVPLYWIMIVSGVSFVMHGLISYFRIKKSALRPPRHQTLVEVTGATLYFLENYQFEDRRLPDPSPKRTMLCRLADLVAGSCVHIEHSFDNKARSELAHERNSLAARRTVFGCYRTIYSLARTGLSFIRTGISFATIGLGMAQYFGLSYFTILDGLIIGVGAAMAIDGVLWSWPVRKEDCEASRCGFIT